MTSENFPSAPAHLHLVGIGGIGMSALAQFFVTLGYTVSGSDRDLETPAQVKLFDKLRSQGMTIFLQDGSGVKETKPDALIYSSAIEEDNPDFVEASETPRFHRSMAMAETVNRSGMKQIAVAGSCGKTSVTGWLASALHALGQNPVMINGGYTTEFISDKFPGNFKPGAGVIVYEADESDGSLVNFRPHTALLLNMGIDHYEKDKLEVFFKEYLGHAEQAVVSSQLSYLIPEGTKEFTFAENLQDDAQKKINTIEHTPQGVNFTVDNENAPTRQFGTHSAINALAVYTTLVSNGFTSKESAKALHAFTGVGRRFDYKGTRGDKMIYDDYAHNVQKIAACIKTAQGLSKNPVIAAFQPHGYGPLGFMKDALLEELKEVLRQEDKFILLPVFYAGGTTSFKPSSEEVATEYSAQGLPTVFFEERDELKTYLDELKGAASVVILGARDPGLADWAAGLTEK
ncbi:MAG: Mur ligase domain-containing protein [Lentisphaeraceae bacterium]|nr:Mur ligase domain-containing protein [Lentisphaeraceae bacterium]